MRLFVAIELSEGLKEKIACMQKNFEEFSNRKEIKLVEPENLHLTLKFLGEVPDNTVKEIAERIKLVSGKFKQFTLSLEELSFFNPPKFIRVIFLDVGKGREVIIEMEKELNNLLRDVREEDYDQHPHLTIARAGFVKEKGRILEKIKSIEKSVIGEMGVSEIKLFKSTLTGKGPIYTEIESFSLKG